jgi:hypothetical protein
MDPVARVLAGLWVFRGVLGLSRAEELGWERPSNRTPSAADSGSPFAVELGAELSFGLATGGWGSLLLELSQSDLGEELSCGLATGGGGSLLLELSQSDEKLGTSSAGGFGEPRFW